jgi:mono/diheme cytochrome c family protein
MTSTSHLTALLVALAATLTLPLAAAANPILDGYKTQAKQENAAFKDFTVAAGQKLYSTVGPNQLSCSSCHTDSPKAAGKHAKTNKVIDPLAPSANPKRFTDAAQVEKWFKRNCNDALGRVCTTQEKGDFMTYVLSVK